jgi:ubiquinol-cytochrome c reductase cytochrome c subunit
MTYRARRFAWSAVALLAGAGALFAFTRPGRANPARLVRPPAIVYSEGCASCHGIDGRGIKNMGPSLLGVGAQAADFYLSTGRMPLDNPGEEPVRTHPAYSEAQIGALVAYIQRRFGGPPIPAVDPQRGDLNAGRAAFTDHCAGCHQSLAAGGIVIGGIAPSLQSANARQIAEAVRVGPYLMPRFTTRQIDARTMDDIAAYVLYTRHPDDRGGWGIGHIGPIPEGMVAWLLALVALIAVARLIGERTPT